MCCTSDLDSDRDAIKCDRVSPGSHFGSSGGHSVKNFLFHLFWVLIRNSPGSVPVGK
ncbi:hypothetical protein GNF10_17455 [Nostoc sp. UCD121]|uniref:hypothetical protein n=1 Tax=unclassified Nostoc TaxID=2593658 RepID=UPI001623583E|nr:MULTISPECIES: hypothetical protein [unclassified Nostoc]MBC1218468.1 hypothetical protein [Nostoc sp. UCD120]MBC1277695.1 hypothetical protein [Nostoc sp. UCD121]MBC1296185.1 hypothetical protein [Nostoc sp. UCD122]